MLQSAAQRLLARTTNLRQLALLLTATAAVLSALVTNDVSLFLLVPLRACWPRRRTCRWRGWWCSRPWR